MVKTDSRYGALFCHHSVLFALYGRQLVQNNSLVLSSLMEPNSALSGKNFPEFLSLSAFLLSLILGYVQKELWTDFCRKSPLWQPKKCDR